MKEAVSRMVVDAKLSDGTVGTFGCACSCLGWQKDDLQGRAKLADSSQGEECEGWKSSCEIVGAGDRADLSRERRSCTRLMSGFCNPCSAQCGKDVVQRIAVDAVPWPDLTL